MNGDFPFQYLPATVATLVLILVSRANKSRLRAVCHQPHAVDVADARCVISIAELKHQVRSDVLRLSPCRPQNMMNSFMNAVVATEITKGGSDLPNTVLPPDGQEALKISFVETMAIVAH